MAKVTSTKTAPKTTVELTLDKPARNTGGDRYVGEYQGDILKPYFPQSLTRINGVPKPSISITFN